MKTVAIVGVGLIGGSFGLALRKAGFSGEILGISSLEAIEAGLRKGAISSSASLEEAAAVADLIYLAQPVDRILATLEMLGPIARAECLITDAGSTKTVIVQKATECVRAAGFVGGHPLAGKEQRGVEAADADLFRGRLYVLTPIARDTSRLETFRSWLTRLGAKLLEISPAEHDAAIALTSHLPQILSTALAHTLAARKDPRVQEIFGPGLLDMTRLALSSPDVWQSIFTTNKVEILEAVEAFAKSLEQVRAAVTAGDLHPVFDAAAGFAQSIRKASLRNE